jgi:hypothetical protein
MVFEEQGASWALCLVRGTGRALVALLALSISACAKPPSVVRPVARTPEPAPPVGSATATTPVERLPRAERRSESFAIPRVVAPKAAERIDSDKASEYSVALETITPPVAATFVLSLDGQRPRPLAMFTSPPKLGELSERGIVSDGPHVLLSMFVAEGGLALMAPSGAALGRVDFVVGSKTAVSALPRVACLAPWGTLYGARSARALLDFMPLDAAQAAFDVTISGPSGTRRALAEGVPPFVLGDLPSGDYEVRVEYPNAPSGVVVPCVFTVNRELEGPR